MKISHWETGKAGYAGAGAMLPIREPEDLQKEKHFAIFLNVVEVLVYAEKRLQRMISLRPFFYINICECVRQIQYK